MSDEANNNQNSQEDPNITSVHVDDMYKDWFLDYASYVILERAVPALMDGLKPVQRRILHAMKEMDDGRFHKVANIIGQTMQFHPHGDAAIGDALVNLGQKDLMIDTQGNWGDIRTGDSAAAPRYIEARLTKFALEVGFNADTTEWQLSYDGRKREPVLLPMKFPLVLAQGAEGIAVGLSTRIMPHNFIELCKGSIDILKGKRTKMLPDFPTGGMIDVTDYKRGKRGGKIKVRAKIETADKKTLLIREIPYGTTTTSVIDSIIKANDKGKLKIKKVVDNTAKDVEIAIELPSGVSPDVTIDALYAFTNCQVSISPNAALIVGDKPIFMTVDDILDTCTESTKSLLKRELEIKLADLERKWHFSSLEKIFIEHRIYRDIEECETWEAVIEAIDKGLDPYKKLLKREVTEEDIVRLTEIKIKRISKYDAFKADEAIAKLESDIEEVKNNLNHLTDFSIAYYQNLIDKYGQGRERKTEIRSFDTIEVKAVAAANKKLYVNRKEGFIGYGLKKDEYVSECSDLDDIIAFTRDGKMKVVRVEDKKFVGKDILYTGVWKKGDDRTIYHMIYFDAGSKRNYVKRFAVTSITRDKDYLLTGKAPNSKVLYFSVHPNSEEEVVKVQLSSGCKAKNKVFEYNFGELDIKGRGSKGNIITKYPIRKVELVEIGESTLGGVDIWFDDITGRLNKDERGRKLGNFDTGDLILVMYKDGSYELTNFELSNRYEMHTIQYIGKLNPEQVFSIVHLDGDSKNHYVKRFKIDATTTGKQYPLITEHRGSKMVIFSEAPKTYVEFTILKGKSKEKLVEQIELSEFIDVKGSKAIGNRLTQYRVSGKPKLVKKEGSWGTPDAPQDNAGEEEDDPKTEPEPEAAAVKTTTKEKSPEKAPKPKKQAKKESSGKSGKDDKGYEVGAVVEFDTKPKKEKSDKEKGDGKSQGELF